MANIFQSLNKITPGVIELQTKIAVNEKDRMAGELLEYLSENLLPGDATNGDAFDVLESAMWWLNLWAAENKAIKIMSRPTPRTPDAAPLADKLADAGIEITSAKSVYSRRRR